jgi:nitrogen regulatory protein PII
LLDESCQKEGFPTKRLDAVITSFQLNEEKDRLRALGVTGLTASEGKGCGCRKGTPRPTVARNTGA